MAYDLKLGAVILFGGDRLGTEMKDTWEWKGGKWTNLTSTLLFAPAGRYDARMAWDPALGALVLFGGSNCILTYCVYTFEFNGAWSRIHTSVTPKTSGYFGLAYDVAAGYLVLSGGQGYWGGTFHPMNQTWAFNGTQWVQLHPKHSPPAEQQAIIAYDYPRGYILDFPLGTGATWIYWGGDWINLTAKLPLSPPARSLSALVMDNADGCVLMMGGAIGVPSGGQAGGTSSTLNDTWAWK
jgi:hypothetical protein